MPEFRGLELRGVSARFGSASVLHEIGFELPVGGIAALLGPSGSGKTTLLRLIAGFETPSAGSLHFDGEQLAIPGRIMPPEERRFAMVFQDHALLPHLDVTRNIGFGLHRLNRKERRQRVESALEMVGLEGTGGRKPHELSGGQQQRVAVARALATRPRLLLLDEPFSSLDEELRYQLQRDLRGWLKEVGVTAVLVTHSQLEAYAVGDWVGVIGQGRLHQWDTPYNVYHRPTNRFVADFVGEGVFIAGELRGNNTVETELGQLKLAPAHELPQGPVDVLLRPDDLLHDDDSPWQATILDKTFRGAEILYRLALPSGSRVMSLVPSHHNHRIGEAIGIRLNLEHVICFPPAGN